MSVSLSAANALEAAIDRKIANAAARRTRTSGTVSRVDVDGTVYVMVDGASSETPASVTSASVKPGDAVTVTVEGGRLSIDGNCSDPSAGTARVANVEGTALKAVQDATSANMAAASAVQSAEVAAGAAAEAQQSASDAYDAAQQAIGDAADAASAAQTAWNHADDANTAAGVAWQHADDANTAAIAAQGSATAANTAANDALIQLATVEDVIGTVNWITEHGTYSLTQDAQVDDSKVYYTRSGSGTQADPYIYTAVAEPTASGLSTYYELHIDAALSQYVASHLALTNAGLYVLKDNNGYKLLCSNTGVSVIDAQGHVVATYGESITFDSSRQQYIGSNDAYILFTPASGSTPAKITIGGTNIQLGTSKTLSQLLTEVDGKADVSDIPTNVSELNNDSGFATTTQAQGYASSAQSAAEATASADATSKANAAQSAAEATAAADATSKANAAQAAAIAAAASDATTKANAAAQTATNYVTAITNGDTWIHEEGHGPDSSGNPVTTGNNKTTGWRIGSVFEMVREGVSWFKLWLDSTVMKLRLGLESSGHILLDSTGMEVFDGSDSVAQFGATARIGMDSDLQIKLGGGSMVLENDTDEEVFSVTEDVGTTVTRSTDLVTFASSSEVDATVYTVSDSLAESGGALVALDTAGDSYALDSTYATATVTAGTGVSVALTSSGVTYVKGLLDESGEPGTLSVEYQASHYDKARLDMIGSMKVEGEGEIASVVNETWAQGNYTNTFLAAENAVTGRHLNFGIGAGGQNRGIYDVSRDRWLMYANADDCTVINGDNFRVSAAGNLTLQGGPSVRINAAAPSTKYFDSLFGYDANGDTTFYSQSVYTTAQNFYRSFVCQRKSANGQTTYNNGFYLHIDNSGNPSVGFTTGGADAWRKGLGADSSGVWPVSLGGTGTTNLLVATSVSGSNVNVSTGSRTQLATISLSAGYYLVIIGCYCADASGGGREWIFTDATAANASLARLSSVRIPGGVAEYVTTITSIAPTATTTYRVHGWQNSGSTLAMSAYIRAFKIR